VPEYILDACALLALFDDEPGADIVEEIIGRAKNNEITLTMNAANLIEVYYDRIRVAGTEQADTVIQDIYDTFPISITILVATARYNGATIVTCDHVELEPVEKQGIVPFLWIRPQF
jgi:predicted nucleic acid-binding protein